jgi:hypothetical protein
MLLSDSSDLCRPALPIIVLLISMYQVTLIRCYWLNIVPFEQLSATVSVKFDLLGSLGLSLVNSISYWINQTGTI